MFEWYVKVVRDNYANFNGRARRSEYWYFTLVNFLIGIVFSVLEFTVSEHISYVNYLYSLAVLIPSIALAVRRLHDVGKSGWYYLLVFFICIGWIWLLVLFCTEGDRGANEYGPDPKNPEPDEFDQIGRPQDY
jgi:uncharacterized membrane protein YhaH (DUF805 family)